MNPPKFVIVAWEHDGWTVRSAGNDRSTSHAAAGMLADAHADNPEFRVAMLDTERAEPQPTFERWLLPDPVFDAMSDRHQEDVSGWPALYRVASQ